jgi:hypothetical protein
MRVEFVTIGVVPPNMICGLRPSMSFAKNSGTSPRTLRAGSQAAKLQKHFNQARRAVSPLEILELSLCRFGLFLYF